MAVVKKQIGDNYLYIDPVLPDWYVLNNEAETIMKNGVDDGEDSFIKKVLLSQLTKQPAQKYNGRDTLVRPDFIDEVWLHITDRCNISCRHCLFSCNSKSKNELTYDEIEAIVNETYGKGTRTFYLTGGEPMFHPEFQPICELILQKPDTKLIILTNAILVKNTIHFLNTLPPNRLFLQISFEGSEHFQESIRGKGTYQQLENSLQILQKSQIKTSLAMTVTNENCGMMTSVIEFASRHNIKNAHYLWLFQEGMAKNEQAASTADLYLNLIKADKKADALGITIDNIKTLEAQIFSSPGLKFDLGMAGFSSIAIGADRKIYPTPAMITNPKAVCGELTITEDKKTNIETIWSNSDVLNRLRSLSVINSDNPLKFITGGGDIDHSFSHTGDFSGVDPYLELKEKMVYYLFEKQIEKNEIPLKPSVILKKGDRVESCSDQYNGVAFTHSGCMLSFDEINGKVGTFYSEAADNPNTDILNPVCYAEDLIGHIPDSARIRSYGCGSPVLDAGLEKGETLVDLGSGAGVECFIASGLVGNKGAVIGIDMLDKMLALASKSSEKISENLGYNNLDFRKGFLENIPVEDDFADKVISNCVINLSKDKIKTFSEVERILKPGGKAIISDVVAATPFPVSIHEDPKLVGECIGGALLESRFTGLLQNAGFINIRIIKRFIYREVDSYKFFSITIQAEKKSDITRQIIYPGPFAGVITDQGQYILRGQETEIILNEDNLSDDVLFEVDSDGTITNSTSENSCDCYTGVKTEKPKVVPNKNEIHKSGCLYCGAEIVYPDEQVEETCYFCKEIKVANSKCKNGHFICDGCHSGDLAEMTENICLTSDETEMITLLNKIRNHSLVPLNGPEHHFIVPGVITAVYRNLGGDISENDIKMAISRGKDVPGGTCGFWGACGATIGAGIALSTILSSSPLTPDTRKIVQQAVSEIAESVSSFESARCCRRESLSVLLKVEEISQRILPITIKAGFPEVCDQFRQNKECPGKECTFFPKSASLSPFMVLPKKSG